MKNLGAVKVYIKGEFASPGHKLRGKFYVTEVLAGKIIETIGANLGHTYNLKEIRG